MFRMKDETKPEKKFSFGKRFRALENGVAELREYLHLPPATDTDEPDRSTLFVIADISERQDPRPEENTLLGFVLHTTTDPRIAHELFRTESARAPGRIGIYTYRHLDVAELRTICDPCDPMIATVHIYLSKEELHRPIIINAPPPQPPSPAKNEIAFGES